MTAESPAPVTISVDGPLSLRESFDHDERLLAAGRPAVRVALVEGRHLSYGVAVPPSAPYVRRAEAAGIPTIRRTTGGTGLLHEDGDLLWSIVLPRSDRRVGRDFVRSYGRLGAGAVRFLGDLGLPGEWRAAPEENSDYCTLGARGEVLRARGQIVGGAAQHVVGGSVLHQSTISVSVDRAEIDRLFGLPSPGPSRSLAGLQGLGGRYAPLDLAHSLAGALAEALSSS